jgi:hypothetical protein
MKRGCVQDVSQLLAWRQVVAAIFALLRYSSGTMKPWPLRGERIIVNVPHVLIGTFIEPNFRSIFARQRGPAAKELMRLYMGGY